MYNNSVITKFKNSIFFNQMFPADDYIMFAFIGGERLVFANVNEMDADYEIVVVTGNTTDLSPGKMLIYRSPTDASKFVRISWIYVAYDVFMNKKNYFKYNYFDAQNFNDLFLYSIYFINDDKLIYLDKQYTDKLLAFYKLKGIMNIKKLIRLFYQYNEERVSALTVDNLTSMRKYLYHFLMMSYLLNNESMTVQIIRNIEDIHKKAKKKDYGFDDNTKKFITERLNLLISLCK